MKNPLASLIATTRQSETTYRPQFFRLSDPNDREHFYALLQKNPVISVFDQLNGQLGELIKSSFPKRKFSSGELMEAIEAHKGGVPHEAYGLWVYYPWSSRLVHILDEEEFVEVRTSRNQYKITRAERNALAVQKIGVVGLSVGQSVAMTMAMERCFGEIRLADFDLLELSNLNRIRTGLHNLGTSKVISIAREIAEIDPFLKITCLTEGVTEENIAHFLLENGKLDVLIDECDSIDIKVLCRLKAREFGIPVVMEASDRGCIDVERYDLEPGRPIFHGLIEHLDTSRMKGLTNEEKIPYLIAIHPPETLSKRMKASMMEVEQTITTWPQLASAVTLGGALAADVCRRMLLNQFQVSGRYFVDLDEIISDPSLQDRHEEHTLRNAVRSIEAGDMKVLFGQMKKTVPASSLAMPEPAVVSRLVQAAITAPTGGNSQPWKWLYSEGILTLFLDKSRSTSFMDYKSLSSCIGLGAAIENLVLKAHELKLEVKIELFPLGEESPLVSAIYLLGDEKEAVEEHHADELVSMIESRCTNRIIAERQLLDPSVFHHLKQLARQEEGAQLHFLDTEEELESMGELIGRAERIRLLNPESHRDFFVNELRWNTAQSRDTNDGVDLMTMNLSDSDIAGLHIAKDPEVMALLKKWGLGKGLLQIRKKTVRSASAVGLITMPSSDQTSHVKGGRLTERIWLAAQQKGVAFQPLYVPLTLFARYADRHPGLSEDMIEEIGSMRQDFLSHFPESTGRCEIMLFRLCLAGAPKVRSLRRPVQEVLCFGS